jgi:mono/diheme cytochrome c family protein
MVSKGWRRLTLGIVGIALLLGAAMAILLLRPAQARAPSTEHITPTPARLARGQYLARHVADCFGCHSDHLQTFGLPVKPGTEGQGGETFGPNEGVPGEISARNITPDVETGLGSWTDGEILRALREGVDSKGRALFPMMPWQAFRALSDEDAKSIVAYLRSLPPIQHSAPASHLDFPVNLLVKLQPKPLVAPVQAPDPSDALAYGGYLVAIAGCASCHAPRDAHNQQIDGRGLSGGWRMIEPWGTVVAANLTPDPQTYVGTARREAFIGRFKSFASLNPAEMPVSQGHNTVMPWWSFSGMTEEDLGAIYDFLRAQPAVHNVVVSFPEAEAR